MVGLILHQPELKKIKARSLKAAWAGVNTSMCMQVHVHMLWEAFYLLIANFFCYIKYRWR